MKARISLLFIVTLFFIAGEAIPAGDPSGKGDKELTDFPYGKIASDLIPTAYSGGETFRFDISYTGGFKLGELHLKLSRCEADEPQDCYRIDALVTTENGIFSGLYPVEDRHVTHVSGPERLPYHYEVWQKEGYHYEAHRVFRYDQDKGKVLFTLNDGEVEIFEAGKKIQNEFSSFFASRVMPLVPGHPFVVPTFADNKRNEVVVMVRKQELLERTILGTVTTLVVEPILKFSGLYDKRGDTVIWYTDDDCRVPVQVNSKLVIGSLTADLVTYNNKACPRYDGAILEKYLQQ